jgi:hypothetical protein
MPDQDYRRSDFNAFVYQRLDEMKGKLDQLDRNHDERLNRDFDNIETLLAKVAGLEINTGTLLPDVKRLTPSISALRKWGLRSLLAIALAFTAAVVLGIIFWPRVPDLKPIYARLDRVDQTIAGIHKRLDDLDHAVSEIRTSNAKLVLDLQGKASNEELKNGLATKVSVDKFYRIQSKLGDWFAGVNDGRGYSGSGLSIATGAASTPSNAAVWWTFVEQ